MANKSYFYLLLLTTLTSSCKAEISVPTTRFNSSELQELPSEETTLEVTNKVLGNPQDPWVKPSQDPQDDIWIWGTTNGTTTTSKPADIDDKWYDLREYIGLPDSFDAREQWPKCRTLKAIYDQGPCLSGWAIASVTAMSDRYCIASNSTKDFFFSAEDALTCSGGGTCQAGGDSKDVYLYWQNKGIVSGGSFNSRKGCKPYRIPPCQVRGSYSGLPCHPRTFLPLPPCLPICLRNYPQYYENDRKKATEVYQLRPEDYIKADIYYNGPVTASMNVYDDFLTYRRGVYKHKSGRFWYHHHVKLMGWGQENGVKYWLAANSWNVQWGERGFFRILRGENHCDIETFVVGGIPKL